MASTAALPQHGEDRDIFERFYAVRLDHLRELEDCRMLLGPFDKHGLLAAASIPSDEAEPDLDDLASELAGLDDSSDIVYKLVRDPPMCAGVWAHSQNLRYSAVIRR